MEEYTDRIFESSIRTCTYIAEEKNCNKTMLTQTNSTQYLVCINLFQWRSKVTPQIHGIVQNAKMAFLIYLTIQGFSTFKHFPLICTCSLLSVV